MPRCCCSEAPRSSSCTCAAPNSRCNSAVCLRLSASSSLSALYLTIRLRQLRILSMATLKCAGDPEATASESDCESLRGAARSPASTSCLAF
eukprot:scaffold28807_cov67-Phaeocystis_antarctica.AAC.2